MSDAKPTSVKLTTGDKIAARSIMAHLLISGEGEEIPTMSDTVRYALLKTAALIEAARESGGNGQPVK